jgi:hypothetical protein
MVLGLFIFVLWVVWIGKPMVMNNAAVTKAAAANVGGENLKALLKELGQE